MSGGGGGRSHVGSGGSSADECGSLDVETILNSPIAAVVRTLKEGQILAVSIEESAKKVRSLVAKDNDGRIAGSLTPPSFIAIISCIEKGNRYGAELVAVKPGGEVRVRIRPSK